MPVKIVEKRKTEPQCPTQHKASVPLRVVEIITNRLRDYYQRNLNDVSAIVGVGDIIFWAGGRKSMLMNATKDVAVDANEFNEAILCVRAYDIAQIVLCNDDEPAPVL